MWWIEAEGKSFTKNNGAALCNTPTSVDGLVGIFEPSILVPAQFFAGLRHKAPAEGNGG